MTGAETEAQPVLRLKSSEFAGVRNMLNRNLRGAAAGALLATTALTMPGIAVAAAPAPDFIDVVDNNGVYLVSGLPVFAIDEGGMGSGPGAVRVQGTWAEGAGLLDNWSGGL